MWIVARVIKRNILALQNFFIPSSLIGGVKKLALSKTVDMTKSFDKNRYIVKNNLYNKFTKILMRIFIEVEGVTSL